MNTVLAVCPNPEVAYRPPAPEPLSAIASLLRVIARGERNLLSLLPAEAYTVKIGRLGWSRRGIVLVNDPAMVMDILKDPQHIFPKNDLMVSALEGLVGRSMFVSHGEVWKRQRRMIDPAFSHMRIDRSYASMFEATEDHVRDLKQSAAKREVLSLDKVMSRLTADIVCRAIFSTSLDQGVARSVFEDFLIFERSCASVDLGRLILGKPWESIPQPPAVAAACERIRSHIGVMLDERKERLETGPDDIAQALLMARDPETGEGFSREELIDQLGVFFLAGHETTASALTWAFFILSQHPHAAKRMRQEYESVVGEGELTLEKAKRLSYTRNVFRESMRLYPPITFIPRVALKNTKIGDYSVQRGNMIMIAPWSLHRHADLWSNPNHFDPDRFVNEEDKAHAVGAYIPFGLGPRVCVGAAFATLEATLILARLMNTFDFRVLDPDSVRPAARLTTRPEKEIEITLSELTKKSA